MENIILTKYNLAIGMQRRLVVIFVSFPPHIFSFVALHFLSNNGYNSPTRTIFQCPDTEGG